MNVYKIDKLNSTSKFYISNITNNKIQEVLLKRCEGYKLQKGFKFVDKLVITFKPEDIKNVKLEDILFSTVQKIIETGIKSKDVIFGIDCQDKNYNFSDEEWNKIALIQKQLNKKGIIFGIEDERATWPVALARNADIKLKKISKFIKEKNLSPFETLIAVWNEVTDNQYISEGKHNESWSRSTIGLLNSEYIVCVGFANYFRTICEYVNDKNIAVFRNNVLVIDDEPEYSGGHQNLVVHIKDDKYGLNGFYYLDPTWDSLDDYYETSISHFMLPLRDIKNLKRDVLNVFSIVPEKERVCEQSPIINCNENFNGNDLSVNMEDCLLDTKMTKFLLKDKELYSLVSNEIDRKRKEGKKFPKYKSKLLECCRYLDEYPEIAELYLHDNSPIIEMDKFISAYNKVLAKTYPNLSKDDISKMVYDKVNDAIEYAKYKYKQSAENCFSECADYTENDEKSTNNENNEIIKFEG